MKDGKSSLAEADADHKLRNLLRLKGLKTTYPQRYKTWWFGIDCRRLLDVILFDSNCIN